MRSLTMSGNFQMELHSSQTANDAQPDQALFILKYWMERARLKISSFRKTGDHPHEPPPLHACAKHRTYAGQPAQWCEDPEGNTLAGDGRQRQKTLPYAWWVVHKVQVYRLAIKMP